MDANLLGTLWQHCPLVHILPGNASLSSSYSMVHSSKMRKSLWKVRISAFGTIWSPGFLITMHLSVCPLPALAAFLWLGTPRSSRRWPCATSLLARATGPAAGLHCRLGQSLRQRSSCSRSTGTQCSSVYFSDGTVQACRL